MDENITISKAKKGDAGAFHLLFDKYKTFVWNVAYRMIYDFDEAEDITQDVFVSAWKSIGSFREDSAFSTWIYRIAVNKTLNRIRKRKDVHDISEEVMSQMVDSDMFMKQNPEAKLEQIEAEEALARLLSRLDEPRRLALVLREIEGLSYEEIAEATGAPIGTVRSRISRGRAELQQIAATMEEV